MALSVLKSRIEDEFGNGTFHVVLMTYTQETKDFATGDINTTTNRIDLSGFTPTPVVNMRVSLTNLSATTDLVNNTTYWLVDNSGTEWGLAPEPDGTAIDLTVAVSGTIADLPPIGTVGGELTQCETVACLARHEINYGTINSGNRPTYTPPGSAVYLTRANGSLVVDADGNTLSAIAGAGYLGSASNVSIAPSGADVSFQYSAVIKGGSATPGNTAGSLTSRGVEGTGETVVASSGAGTLQLPFATTKTSEAF
jgi:hypothetical protein